MISMTLPRSIARFASLLAIVPTMALAENITILHVGDQESWLISAQGNLRDDANQAISFYGGIDRLATVMNNAQAAAQTAGRSVIKLNAGDSLLPGPRLTASFTNLATAYNGGQDFYDTIALRALDFDAVVFGNHEFDLGVDTAARFADVSETSYLSINLDFTQSTSLNALLTAGKVGASKIVTTSGGRKVGIIGVTTPLLPTISSPQTLALMNGFAGFSQSNSEAQNLAAVLPTVQAEINELRNVDGVDVVVVMSHLQNANNERTILVPGLRNVDLVVSGGGHELMTDPNDLLINGGVAATFTTHPIYQNDLDNQPVPIVTGHFGNRYVGELNATIGTNPGDLAITSTRMLRVSGAAADADRVTGNATLLASVVTPVRSFIAALNAQIIGTSNVRLNADRGGAGTAPRNYAPGIRKSETNLGNLVADAMRFSGSTDVAIQNGGGVRTSIAGPVSPALTSNVTEGDTFNVLPFTNLVKVATSMNGTQLKDILEHGFGGTNTTPSGGEEGRFPQVSGMQVIYDTTKPARTTIGTGSRVRKVTLTRNTPSTGDDLVLIDYGVVVDSTPFSFTTIDFTAAGGDGYPFAANNVQFVNSPFTITYQAAMSEYIQAPVLEGGLGGVISSVNDPDYAAQNIFDDLGRMIDMIVGTTGVDAIVGTAGRDQIDGGPGIDSITGGLGADVIRTGTGADTVLFTNLNQAGDTLLDFVVGEDKIDLSAIFATAGVPGALGSNVIFVNVNGGVNVQIILNGRRTPLATVRNVTAAALNNAANFIL